MSASGRVIAILFAPSAVCAGLLFACSLTTSLDGLSNGPEVSETGIGPGGGEGATSEAASVPDGSPGDEGGALDAASDAPSGPFCDSLAPKPTFCDDFERTSLLGAWDNRSLSGGGSVTLEPSTRTPAGHELLASIPVFPSGSVSVASLDRTFFAAQEVTLSYALRIEAPPTQGQQQIMLVEVTPPASNGDFFHTYLYVSSTGAVLVEETFPGGSAGGAFIQNPLSAPIVFGTWQRIDMTLKLTSPPHLVLSVNGKVAFDAPADSFYRPGIVAVSAGIHYTNTPSGPLSVRVDDLYVDLK